MKRETLGHERSVSAEGGFALCNCEVGIHRLLCKVSDNREMSREQYEN